MQIGSLISGADDARKVPEHNKNNRFFWMENPAGRIVPVGIHEEREKQRRGYIHTDKKICSDDLSERVSPPAVAADPMARLADAMEKVIEKTTGKKEVEEEEKEKPAVSQAVLEKLEKARAVQREKREARLAEEAAAKIVDSEG